MTALTQSGKCSGEREAGCFRGTAIPRNGLSDDAASAQVFRVGGETLAENMTIQGMKGMRAG